MLITIKIDCDPFSPRPDIYAKHIFAEILKQEYRNNDSACFGCWTWEDVECTQDQEQLIGEYLKFLYAKGCIRYASW